MVFSYVCLFVVFDISFVFCFCFCCCLANKHIRCLFVCLLMPGFLQRWWWWWLCESSIHYRSFFVTFFWLKKQTTNVSGFCFLLSFLVFCFKRGQLTTKSQTPTRIFDWWTHTHKLDGRMNEMAKCFLLLLLLSFKQRLNDIDRNQTLKTKKTKTRAVCLLTLVTQFNLVCGCWTRFTFVLFFFLFFPYVPTTKKQISSVQGKYYDN